MEESTQFIERLRTGQPAFGTMLRVFRNPAAAAIAKQSGLDFAMVDMEHGAYGFETVSDIALVARAVGLGIMARIPELSRNFVCRAVDSGIQGIMVPMLETAEEAENLVAWSKYPPEGKRGLSSNGGHTLYKKPADIPSFLAEQNRGTYTIAQIETVAGVKNAFEIARVPGLDALLVGPNDLAVSLGRPGELTSEPVEEAIAEIARAAGAAGKTFGVHVGTALLDRWAKHNLKLFMNDIDESVYAAGLRKINDTTREIAARHT